MIQETFMMIKPDGIEDKDEIFKMLEENGLNIKRYNKIIIYSILFGSQKNYLYLCIVGQKEVQQNI